MRKGLLALALCTAMSTSVHAGDNALLIIQGKITAVTSASSLTLETSSGKKFQVKLAWLTTPECITRDEVTQYASGTYSLLTQKNKLRQHHVASNNQYKTNMYANTQDSENYTSTYSKDSRMVNRVKKGEQPIVCQPGYDQAVALLTEHISEQAECEIVGSSGDITCNLFGANEIWINGQMVEKGLARADLNSAPEQLNSLMAKAKADNAGTWASGFEDPTEWKLRMLKEGHLLNER